jgi:hypothetical protein
MRIRQHVSYANICASLALFIALGGSGYAAMNLPRDSVGTRELRRSSVGASELRDNAVTSRNVRDGSLAAKDLSAGARSALAGASGPTGPKRATGPQGERGAKGDPGTPGADAETLRAVVREDAAVFDSSGSVQATFDPVDHYYVVTFPRSVVGCVFSATLARLDGIDPVGTRITVEPAGSAVRVRIYQGATLVASTFHLIVVCS